MAARVNLHILDQLLRHHPDLKALRATRSGRALTAAAPQLARLLVGAISAPDHPLVRSLLTAAPQELAILSGLCRGNTLRALTCTVALLHHLARRPLDDTPDPNPDDAPPGVDLPAPTPDDADDDDQDDDQDDADAEDTLDDADDADAEDTHDDADDSDQDADDDDASLDADAMVDEAFQAVTEQAETLDRLDALLPDMGWGFGRGHLEQALLDDMSRFTALLEQAETLRRVADELGRFERAQRQRKPPPRGGRDAVVGVRFSGELADVLPAELALLGDPATEDLFYQRYTEHRLLSLELEGPLGLPDDASGRGPVIMCVDTSGSMAGLPEALAKALVLAVMRQVLPQGRRLRLMLFGGPGDFRDIDIARGPGAMRHFLDLLAMRFNAGTDFDSPLDRAMALLEEAGYEQADVLVVTDGYGRASPALIQRLARLRDALGFEVASVVIGGSPRGVAPFSDRVWTLPAREGALEALDLRAWSEGAREP